MPTPTSRDVDRLYVLLPVRTCMCRDRIRDFPSPEEANGRDVFHTPRLRQRSLRQTMLFAISGSHLFEFGIPFSVRVAKSPSMMTTRG